MLVRFKNEISATLSTSISVIGLSRFVPGLRYVLNDFSKTFAQIENFYCRQLPRIFYHQEANCISFEQQTVTDVSFSKGITIVSTVSDLYVLCIREIV